MQQRTAAAPPIGDAEDARTDEQRRGNRRDAILEAAGHLFAQKGYDGTSMREIAAAVGMLPGSLYYHFASKEDLFAAIHAEAIDAFSRAVDAAVATAVDPWARLERGLAAHLAGMVRSREVFTITSPDFPCGREDLNRTLIAARDGYEAKLAALVADLPVEADRKIVRLMLLGAVNWTPVWFRADGGLTPDEIARAFVDIARHGAGGGRSRARNAKRP